MDVDGEIHKKLDMSLDEIEQGRRNQENRPNPGGHDAPHAEGNAHNTHRDDNSNGSEDADMDVGTGRRVYVGNLSWKVKWQDLKDHMRSAGDVEHAIIMEVGGRSKGCGIVTYATESEAQNAIDTLNDTELDGRKIFVREDREENVSGQPRVKGCRVYVGNLPWTVKWQALKDHMKQAGTVIHADVLEEAGGWSKGCGLVEFSSPDEAQNAIDMLNDTELEGRNIFVREDREPDGGSITSIARRGGRGSGRSSGGRGNSRFAGRAPREGNSGYGHSSEIKQVYVGNLPWDTTSHHLENMFQTAGDVERAEVVEFPDGRSRGFGIVKFKSGADAQCAIDELNGTEHNGRRLEVRLDKRG
ncbi:unnamed protein product [Albugo candida]|uniref:RRM domain-containing protein n=1 Tax=Albugo candida TaxID=65357 RepID=A0A024G2G2_9STRA|nr:unnamed protein product [Albugo candida]|eukprot:CCI40752.1 unnamed protein product [Albugo candida]